MESSERPSLCPVQSLLHRSWREPGGVRKAPQTQGSGKGGPCDWYTGLSWLLRRPSSGTRCACPARLLPGAPRGGLRWKYTQRHAVFVLKATDRLFSCLDRYEKKRPGVSRLSQSLWPRGLALLDSNLEPAEGLFTTPEKGTIRSALENGAPPPRSGLAEREPFCLQPRKKVQKEQV